MGGGHPSVGQQRRAHDSVAHDLYIPMDAVVNRAGDELFVNVPKLVVGAMPWREPPRRAQQELKQGPKAGDVDKLYGSRGPSAMGPSP
jgi:ureidoacrylate peracid hydrolase